MRRLTLIALLSTAIITACAAGLKAPNLGGLYNSLVQHQSPYRNPVVVIPGLMGSRLIQARSNAVVWGAFGPGVANPNTAAGARSIALPMEMGKKLKDLKDDIVSTGALGRVEVNLAGYPLELSTYAYILDVLGVGGYRDQDLAEAGVLDYGDRHFTCFQFGYDWRRDIVESARALGRFLKTKRKYVQQEIEKRFGIKNHNVKFDVVAHSMGGLVARYYLRYGAADLPSDGSLPELTWAGSRYVEHLIVIGTPNAGSMDALLNLVKGFRPAMLLPRYPAAVIGTMPSVYQLLPRSRHLPLLDEKGHPVKDILAPKLWIENGWGLADPQKDRVLKNLFPKVESAERRRQVAMDHLGKSLRRARQFFAAMDVPAKRPTLLHFFLIAGDSEATNETAQFDSARGVSVIAKGPGDGVVLRRSALMDERPADRRSTRLVSPIQWSQVLFLFAGHLDLTRNPAFTDNLLYFLLESQRD